MPSQELTEQNDERSPLLRQSRHPTPLPAGQLFALLLLMIAEPVMAFSVLPYINELVGQLPITGGDEKKVGYYAGIIMSLYFGGEAATVLLWSRLSDFIGRKPVLLRGTLGLVVATILFGLSRTFWTLAASRFLAGALNGNIGVLKCVLAEISDETNMARAFATVPLSWAIGSTVGSYLGGLLSRPQDSWPGIFGHPFWKRHPYFLPSAASSMYGIVTLIVASVLLRETLRKSPPEIKEPLGESNLAHLPDAEHNNIEFPNSLLGTQDQQELLSSTLFTRPVILSIAQYGTLSFLEMSTRIFVPLVYTTSIRLGGLGLDPGPMGVCMAVWGIICGTLQLTAFDPILKSLGLRRTFITLTSCLVPSFLLFPINGTHAQNSGTDVVLWVLVLVQMLCLTGVMMSYGCTFIYISSAAPSGMLGATNGLAQTVASVQRAIAPAITASLFSFSLENNIMGGYGVFYAMTLCSLAAVWLALRHPPNRW